MDNSEALSNVSASQHSMSEILAIAQQMHDDVVIERDELQQEVARLKAQCQSLAMQVKSLHEENAELRARSVNPSPRNLVASAAAASSSSSSSSSANSNPNPMKPSTAPAAASREVDYKIPSKSSNNSNNNNNSTSNNNNDINNNNNNNADAIRKNAWERPAMDASSSSTSSYFKQNRVGTVLPSSSWLQVAVYRHHSKPVHGIAVHEKADIVATVSWDAYVRLHDVVPGLMDGSEVSSVWAKRCPHGLYSVAFSKSMTDVFGVGCADNMAYLWNYQTKELLQKLEGHTDEVNCIAFHYSQNVVATVSDDRSLRVWDAASGEAIIVRKEAHDDVAYGCAFQPNGTLLASVGFDQKGVLWDVRSNQQKSVGLLNGHSDDVIGVAFDDTGVLVATGSDDATAIVWDIRSLAKPLETLKGHSAEVKRIAFNPSDSRLLATTSGDMTCRIWDLQTMRCCETLTGHTDHVFDVAWAPDGAYLVTASHDHTWRLWKPSDHSISS